jgi:Zc3h12a-like Ribonuclease NYN domain
VTAPAEDEYREPVTAVSSGAERTYGESNIVLVDGSNVAHSTEGERPQLANIVAVRQKLAEEGREPIVVVDASLRHQIDDRAGYEQLVDEGIVRQAPAGTDADYFLLSFARELDARIVSNDRFRDRMKQFPESIDRLVRYMILEKEVVFEWRAHKRTD